MILYLPKIYKENNIWFIKNEKTNASYSLSVLINRIKKGKIKGLLNN